LFFGVFFFFFFFIFVFFFVFFFFFFFFFYFFFFFFQFFYRPRPERQLLKKNALKFFFRASRAPSLYLSARSHIV